MSKQYEKKQGIKASDQQPATSSNQSNVDYTAIKNYTSSKNKWHHSDLSTAIRDGDFKKVKDMTEISDKLSDEELLKTIARNMCDSNYRNTHEIDKEDAFRIFAETKDQLQLMGEDITDIVQAWDSV